MSPEDSHRAMLQPPTRNRLFFILSTRIFFAQNENRVGPTTFEYQWQEFRHYLHAKKHPLMLVLMSRIPLTGRCSFHCSPEEGTHLKMNSFASIMPLSHKFLHFIGSGLCITPWVACSALQVVVCSVPVLTGLKRAEPPHRCLFLSVKTISLIRLIIKIEVMTQVCLRNYFVWLGVGKIKIRAC